MSTDLSDYIAERDNALRTLDLAWARRQLGGGGSDEMLLIAMHKSRYESAQIEPELRHESARWLKERGYSRIAGLPWPKDGELPA